MTAPSNGGRPPSTAKDAPICSVTSHNGVNPLQQHTHGKIGGGCGLRGLYWGGGARRLQVRGEEVRGGVGPRATGEDSLPLLVVLEIRQDPRGGAQAGDKHGEQAHDGLLRAQRQSEPSLQGHPPPRAAPGAHRSPHGVLGRPRDDPARGRAGPDGGAEQGPGEVSDERHGSNDLSKAEVQPHFRRKGGGGKRERSCAAIG